MTTSNRVVVIDYGLGNVASVVKAFHAVGASAVLSSKKDDLEKASHIVLPGVGAFGNGMEKLMATGLIQKLTSLVNEKGIPFLGICLGMQLLADQGFEYGRHAGLGWIAGDVVKMDGEARLPHVGWNDIAIVNEGMLFRNVPDMNFYFVHSYHLVCQDARVISATCEYGQTFVAALQKDNIFGAQFHPEKSQTAGLQVLRNFLSYA